MGTGFQLGENTPASVYVGGFYVAQLAGDGETVTFTSGTTAANFGAEPTDDFGEISLGLVIGGKKSAVSGGVEAQTLIGDDVDGYGANANLRVNF